MQPLKIEALIGSNEQPSPTFVRSGYVYLVDGRVNVVGSGGRHWPQTTNSSTTAYYLLFGSSGIDSSYSGGNHSGGFPLRCLYVV